MNIWFLILIIWLAIESGVALGKNGEPKTGNHSFWTSLISYSIIIWLAFKAIQTGF